MPNYRKYLKGVGVGGINCPCCFPAPRSVGRKAHYRAAKRREEVDAFRIEQLNMNADDEPQTAGDSWPDSAEVDLG